jgi:hypothetical protein
MKTTTNLETRKEAGADAITTNLTINWEGMAQEDIIALAQQALIVKLQSNWRKNGIPAGAHEVNANDYRPGVRAARTPKDPLTLINAMTPEARADLIAKLLAEAAG